MIRAVLFDAAGTLFRVRGSVGAVYARLAAPHGVPARAEDIEQRFRVAFRNMPPLAFPGVPTAELPAREASWWKEVVRTTFSGTRFADFDAFFDGVFAYFARPEAWELFSDVRPTLNALRARHLRLGIVSNFDGRLPSICDGLGIADAFDAFVLSTRAGCAKPDPRIFAIACERLAVAPHTAVHVGDSESEDVHGARAAGLRALLIRRDATPGDSPDCLVDLRQLVDRL